MAVARACICLVFERTLLFDPRLTEYNATFGIAPLLLTCLAAMNMRLRVIERRPGTNHVTLRTDGGVEVTYAALGLGLRSLRHDLRALDRLLDEHPQVTQPPGGHAAPDDAYRAADDPVRAPLLATSQPPTTPPLYATITKAAALAWAYVGEPAFVRWILGRSGAMIHDESGLSPLAYPATTWRVRGYGSFRALELSYTDLRITEIAKRVRPDNPLYNQSLEWRADREKFFANCPPLPFVFG